VVHDESGPLARYKLFFSKPHKLLKRPIISLGMLVLKTTEYVSAGFGYLQAKLTYRQSAGERG
jgi:hypothetical protein